MGFDFRLPKITGTTESEQLTQIKSYLYQLVEQLQWAMNNLDTSREGGKGAAFGKYATHENLSECEWDARLNSKLYLLEQERNIVIEQGTKSINTAEETAVNWHYRKWLDGSLECWCRRNVDVNVNIAWGSALYYGTATTINYPFAFVERPICQITCEYGTDEVSLFIASCGTGTNVYATPVMLCRTDAKTVNCNILYHAHGRWR